MAETEIIIGRNRGCVAETEHQTEGSRQCEEMHLSRCSLGVAAVGQDVHMTADAAPRIPALCPPVLQACQMHERLRLESAEQAR